MKTKLFALMAFFAFVSCEKEPTECTQCREEWTKNGFTSIRQYNVTDCSDDGRTYQQLTEYGIVTVKTTCW